ncbi:MAG TPA: TonB-dependent receptor [Desulfatiglandales bacterium]|nr:TonB-dependent receptor [Desulfatiglandales bacterium]
MLRYVLIVVLFVMIMMPGICWSAEEREDNKEEIYTLDEIIVSATKTLERRGDISNSVILLDKEDIGRSTASGFGDMLGNENGIDLRTRGDYGGATQEIHIRGMGADGALVLVNGIVINSPSIGSANISGVSLNGIEKIEVVKGSGSLLYGTGAMAGVINIITKRPEKGLADLELSAGYGSNATYEMAASQGMFLTEDLGYYLTANRRETDGFRSNAGLDHKDISLKLIYDNEDGPDISFYGDYTDRIYGNPGVKSPSGTRDFIINGIKLYDTESSNLLNEGGDEDMHLAFDINGAPLDRLRLNLKGTYMDMESYNKNVYYFFTLSGSKTWVTNRVESLEGNADIDLFKGMNLLIGAEYKRYDWENRGITLNGNGAEINGTETEAVAGLHTFGLLSEAQYRPNDHIKMIAGLRRERHSEFGIEYVPRYGTVISPYENTAIKLNYGRHYNAPTPNALFWPYEDWGWGMGTQGNRNLKPETGKHSDAGIEQVVFNDKLFINVNYFKWDIKDKISWIPDASFFYTPQNLNRYKSHGWEIGLEARPLYNLRFSLAYTYTDAEEEMSGGVTRRALYTSDSYFKSSMAYLNDAGLNASATIRYTGERPAYYSLSSDTEPSVTLASYYTIDLKLEKDFLDKWFISLQCNNLLDKEYDTYIESFRDHESGITSMEGYPGEGRSFLFRVSYRY